MASSKEMSGDEFNVLKHVVSTWYDDRNCLPMLKVLFRDQVNNPILEKIGCTHYILDQLCILGYLTSRNYSIIRDTIRITKHLGLQAELQKSIASFPNVVKGAISREHFSTHRQELMKLGMVLNEDNVRDIDKMCNTPLENYTDSWQMITDLENRRYIRNGQMDLLLDILDRLQLPLALEALNEDKGGDRDALKRVVSTWYDDRNCLPMLKVLFTDLVNTPILEKIISTEQIFDELCTGGHLKSTSRYFSIICDTIRITEHYGLHEKLREKNARFPWIDKEAISENFTIHRQRLMKLGMLLTAKNVREIDKSFNKPLKNYTDCWHMITDLETRVEIEDGNMETFIEVLRTLQLPSVLRALIEDMQESSLDIDRPTEKPVQQPDFQDPSLDIVRPTKGPVQKPDKDPPMAIDRPTGEPVQQPDIQASSLYRPIDRPTGELVQKPESSLKTYRITSGICLIINNSVFQENKLKSLPGYNIDEESLKNVFEGYFGFDVDVRRNQSAKEIERAIDEYSKAVDYTTYDCFICCILSHGNKGFISGSDCKSVDISRITNPFRSTECEGLVGKPKLFFFQACRGDREPEYVAASADETPRRLWPDDLDFLFGYSTVEGNSSFVYNEHGSPYIQNLTRTLRDEPVKNIFNILTSVTYKVSRMAEYVWEDRKIPIATKMQIPILNSTLSRQVIFSPKSACVS